jgi:8-oxo-dGTP pyrophosphatase MutT (NUDIX family)
MCSGCYTHECDENKCHAAGILITTIIDNKKYALLGRASVIKNIARRGKYEFFGGISKPGETPQETAIRETMEETLGTIVLDKPDLKLISFSKNALGNGYILYEYVMDYRDILKAIIKFNNLLNKENILENWIEVDKMTLLDMSNIFKEPQKISKFVVELLQN